jgi:hypothetical protein
VTNDPFYPNSCDLEKLYSKGSVEELFKWVIREEGRYFSHIPQTPNRQPSTLNPSPIPEPVSPKPQTPNLEWQGVA